MASIKYKVVSDSMSPLIPVGAELFLEKIDGETKVDKFDIVVFLQDNKLTCHYVWHVNVHFDKGFVVTRALKTNQEDMPFERSKIIGRVTNYKISLLKKLMIEFKNRK